MKPYPKQIWFKWNGKESETINVQRVVLHGQFSLISYTIGDGNKVMKITEANFLKHFGRSIEQAKEKYAKVNT